jgi:hypothetical protein
VIIVPFTTAAKVRHGIVLSVWRVIDKIANFVAKRVTLPTGVSRNEDIAYQDDGIPAHRLDVYSPETINGSRPVIIY